MPAPDLAMPPVPHIQPASAAGRVRRRARTVLRSGLLLTGLVAGLLADAPAGVRTVTSLADSGPGTLRQTIADALAGDTIVFSVTGTVSLSNAQLPVDKDLAIAGPGQESLEVRGGGARVFSIEPGRVVTLSGIAIRNGQTAPGEPGGGIYNAGQLSLLSCVVAGNRTQGVPTNNPGGLGGGIFNLGTLLLSNSVVSSNGTGMGGPGGSGGGVFNGGALQALRTRFEGNQTGAGLSGTNAKYYGAPGQAGGSGGGIYSTGSLFLVECTVNGNSCGGGGTGGFGQVGGGSGGSGGGGGGVWASSAILERCTVVSNRAGLGGTGGASTGASSLGGYGGSGGGLQGGAMWLTNCTVAGNNGGSGGEGGIHYIVPGVPQGQAQGGAGGDGGGVASGHTNVTMDSCTLAWNRAGGGGFGGLPSYPNPGPDGNGGGVATGTAWQGGIRNTLIATNGGAAPDVSGTFVSLGHNLVGMTNGASGFTAAGDMAGSTNAPVDPRLGTLGDEGGFTWTIPLLTGSPAIDAGVTAGPPTDQRGVERPQGAAPDIGAVEFLFSVPSFTSATFVSPGAFALHLRGLPYQTYAVESSTNLTQWTEVTAVVTGGNGLKEVVDRNLGPAPSRCYRLRWLAP